MRTKDFILLGAGYAAGRLSKKMNAGPIGATSRGKIRKETAFNLLDEYRYMHLEMGFPENMVIEGILKKNVALKRNYLEKLISQNKEWLKMYSKKSYIPKEVINKNIKIPA